MRRFAGPVAVLTGALVLTGCGGSDDAKAQLSVGSAYIPQPVSDMAAGFLDIANKGGAKDELTSVTSDLGPVSVHETVGQSMEEVTSLDVPAHGQLVFKSGGNHLMFDKLKHTLKQGDNVTVKLHFAKSGPLTVEMPVKSATYNPTTGH
ncbi:copper chaperone PCu(A)C [Streptomyces sp. W16]|uniref:copper chaperone PCu(A)C n=1 Tax=Streptomyces sp. W16 TaxID=3076631 RepID=UPI00295B3190|nr:copper chaperone PCu(A)C [Streptomyces sp. W16]MDV9170702.1 copper chaperone PCu(A)C [Streptomyces sp. W16]